MVTETKVGSWVHYKLQKVERGHKITNEER